MEKLALKLHLGKSKYHFLLVSIMCTHQLSTELQNYNVELHKIHTSRVRPLRASACIQARDFMTSHAERKTAVSFYVLKRPFQKIGNVYLNLLQTNAYNGAE
jgi:hypothetical protein